MVPSFAHLSPKTKCIAVQFTFLRQVSGLAKSLWVSTISGSSCKFSKSVSKVLKSFYSQFILVNQKPSHTRSSWAGFNHGLVVWPQGYQGFQKIQKNVLQINLLSLANIEWASKNLQRPSKMTDFFVELFSFFNFGWILAQ